MSDSLKFGTSGLRGLAVDLIGAPSARYATAFLAYLQQTGAAASGGEVLVGRDLRESSPAITEAVVAAVAAAGMRPRDCGALATPALALAALGWQAPAIMVTGSHIPADRNGLKFYLPNGEIGKDDEAGIIRALRPGALPPAVSASPLPMARTAYLDRYLSPFGTRLAGLKIGVFQHSSVMRDDLVELLEGLGATVVPLGRADTFVPIDTEAVSAEIASQVRRWVGAHDLDALVSTDGDADRPLLADETGTLVRGDMLGLLTARFIGADCVVTPVTSNSAIEAFGAFARVVRTKVGSPFVIAGMQSAHEDGARLVAGFEANGGFLLGSDAKIGGRTLAALPTRDAVLPLLSVLAAAKTAGVTVSQLVGAVPARTARSDRLEQVPQAATAAFLTELADTDFARRYFAAMGEVKALSTIDGLRFVLASGDVVHYRASGNAPELRCYTEAAIPARADELLAWGLAQAEDIVRRR